MVATKIFDAIETGADEGEELFNLPRHLRCATHRLNLVATGNSVTAALNNPRCKAVHRSLMAKLTTIWNRKSKSTVFSDLTQEKMGMRFVITNSTRWNSL